MKAKQELGKAVMKQRIKQWIKKGLVSGQIKQYHRQLEQKTVTYDGWIRMEEKVWLEQAAAESAGDEALAVRCIPYSACRDYLMGTAIQAERSEAVVFAADEGRLSAFAMQKTAQFFVCHPETDLAYADEDVMSPEGIRYTPWLKPDWSPDTFLSFFYFGSVFAVRARALQALTQSEKQWIWADTREGGCYRLCFVLAVKSGGFKKQTDCLSVGHMDEILFHSNENREMEFSGRKRLNPSGCPLADDREGSLWPSVKGGCESGLSLSVIIPSKDNPEVLKRCITSLQNNSQLFANQQTVDADGLFRYEVIVVDNGSDRPVKQELESWLMQQGGDYHYIYQPMPFHFSKMCNLGAEAASGRVLLFLNDDVEIPADSLTGNAAESCTDRLEKGILQVLYQKAVRPFTGAVGVKLYYPDSRRIQHAGIVNLQLGPVHKLQFREDDQSCQYGWNRRERNVIAVTGACLAVEREKFKEAGGFAPELPVAFNDVDICFALYEKGYYNVVLQEQVLFHYESLSRGNDDDREKLNRLLGERDKLYERHPLFRGYDPFYHKYYANEILSTGFELRSDYDAKPQIIKRLQKKPGWLEAAREDACMMISMEYADGRRYLIQGYSFIAGSDNACFEKYVMLRPEAEQKTRQQEPEVWYIKAQDFIRKDVEQNLPDQLHVGMTGFFIKLEKGVLPDGSYRVGIMGKERYSGQKIYAWTNRYLTVEEGTASE